MTFRDHFIEWSNTIPWWVIITMYVIVFGGLFLHILWNIFVAPKLWVKVADFGGWVYYQHKNKPTKRRCEPSSTRQRPNRDWINGLTDDLGEPKPEPDTTNVVAFAPK